MILKGRTFAGVTWGDAHSTLPSSAFSEHEIPHGPIVVTTWGWVLRNDDEGISLAAEWCHDGSWRGCVFIPRPMIREYKELVFARLRKPLKEPV